MSTAILISGQLRTFARCWPTQRWHVLRHFADPHFFITVQGEPGAVPVEVIDLMEEFGADRVHYDPRTDPQLWDEITTELTNAYHQAPYANAAPAHQLLLQHWYQREVWKHFKGVEESRVEGRGAKPFDTIIRMRADLWFHSFELPPQLSASSTPRPSTLDCFCPWWGRFGGVNDRFAIMGPEAAKAYFTLYDHIPELLSAGCPFHPESLLLGALERSRISYYEDLKTEFSTLRTTGEMRWPEISTTDLAHAALRAA